MADLGSSLKGLWIKSMESIGNTASSIASSTRTKVDEMNLVNRRTEILKDFGNAAYALWQKGEHFPAELESQLEELGKLDEQLNDLRAERLAGVKTRPETEEQPGESEEAESKDSPEAAPAGTEDLTDAAPETAFASETDSVPVIQVEKAETADRQESLSSAISDLFEHVSSSEESAGKISSAADSFGEGREAAGDKTEEDV